MGVCYGQTSHVPLFYESYNGSIPDKSYFPYVLRRFPSLEDQEIVFVLDQAFVTKTNLKEMADESSSFKMVSSLPKHFVDTQRIIERYREEVQKVKYYIDDLEVYGMQAAETLFGQPIQAYLYYDLDKHTLEQKGVFQEIVQLEEELKALGKSSLGKKKYRTYFNIEENQTQSFTFERDEEAIEGRLKSCGYFVLMSTKEDLTAKQVLIRYRIKDEIEKVFDGLKNDLDFMRLKTQQQKTTDGKLFIAFIVLILKAYVLNCIKQCQKRNECQ